MVKACKVINSVLALPPRDDHVQQLLAAASYINCTKKQYNIYNMITKFTPTIDFVKFSSNLMQH